MQPYSDSPLTTRMESSYLHILFFVFTLFVIELLYFRIAEHFNIVDAPNHRSSHKRITIRGGGIIFPASLLFWFILSNFQNVYFISGLFLISTVSFLDDIFTLNSGIRSVIQSLAIILLLYTSPLSLHWYYYFLIFIVIKGTINAYNFMDGINGITGAYSFVALISVLYINNSIEFTDTNLIVCPLLAISVFNFFNFRKKAKCFAGDVGSVSIAFIIIYLLTQLILKTNNFLYASILLVYGLDTVTTIIFRVIRKEKITEAHRSHFYQFLANQKKWKHLQVSTLYCIAQLTVNIVLLVPLINRHQNGYDSLYKLIALSIISAIGFIVIRFSIEGKDNLLKPKLQA